MDCVICFEEFNGELNTPIMCVTCGQTACISCFRKVRKEVPACCKYNLHVAHWFGNVPNQILLCCQNGGAHQHAAVGILVAKKANINLRNKVNIKYYRRCTCIISFIHSA